MEVAVIPSLTLTDTTTKEEGPVKEQMVDYMLREEAAQGATATPLGIGLVPEWGIQTLQVAVQLGV